MRVLTIVFFTLCALAASYVSAVAVMAFWTNHLLLIPYDMYGFLTCPLSGTCVEYSRDLYAPTLVIAGIILVFFVVVFGGLYVFRNKIKMPEKLIPVIVAVKKAVIEKITLLVEKIRRPKSPNAGN